MLEGEKEGPALQFCHSVMRYLVLSYVLAVRRVSSVVQDIFPTSQVSCVSARAVNELLVQEIVRARLITRSELEIMEGEGDLEKIWWMPLCWAMKLTREYADVFMTSEDC